MSLSNRQRARRVQAIFMDALDVPAAKRFAFVAQACGDDHELREEVEALLRAHNTADDDFLRPVPASPPIEMAGSGSSDLGGPAGELAENDVDSLIGRTVDGFRIIRRLADGGMGVVYLAEQSRPRRFVALKMMRPGLLARSVLRRFEYETQLLARLSHPGIAQIYEAGEIDGAPFFAMEYIPDALPITEYAARNALPLRRRIELFLQACDAVQYGHQRGILHRDLKPANILVAEDDEAAAPRVKVIDFGVARATDADVTRATLVTETGQLLGTLQYMSPEQCAADPLDLDVRSDVYALGVVLYELLCGRLPYDVTGATLASAARIICEVEPPRPSTITSGTRRAGTTGIRSGPRLARPEESAPCSGPRPAGPEESASCSGPRPARPHPAPRGRLDSRVRGNDGSDTAHSRATPSGPHAARPSPVEPDAAPPAGGADDAVPAAVRNNSRVEEDTRGAGVRIRGDLERIILTALAKDRAQRYASAADLARDIRHYLAGEPIEAKRPTLWARLLRWAGRHPVMATATFAVCCGLLIGGASAYVSNYYVLRYQLNRPAQVVIDEESHTARLVSQLGVSLHEWENVSTALLVDRPESFGGGRLAIVGHLQNAPAPLTGAVCAYELDGDWSTPKWTLPIRDEEMPPVYVEERGFRGVDCNPRLVNAADIFAEPDTPGNELVIAYEQAGTSLCALRIVRLDNKVLYHVWHDGGVNSVLWVQSAGVLVVSGANGKFPWDARGFTGIETGGTAHPRVAYAIRPTLGFITRQGVYEKPSRANQQDPLRPLWYYTCYPPRWENDAAQVEVMKFDCYEPMTRDAESTTATLAVQLWDVKNKNRIGTVHFDVDVETGFVSDSRTVVDPYRRYERRGRLPDPSTWRLVPLPPPLDPRWADDPPQFTPPEYWTTGVSAD